MEDGLSQYLPERDPGRFASAVGRAMQSYGLIEYIVNDIIVVLVKDPTLQQGLLKKRISDRLKDLFKLLDTTPIQKHPHIELGQLKEKALSAFMNRNKIAHNPLFIKVEACIENGLTKSRQVTLGIRVIRYAENNVSELIDLKMLEILTIEATEVTAMFLNLQRHLHKILDIP